jgi:hypothetical protein
VPRDDEKRITDLVREISEMTGGPYDRLCAEILRYMSSKHPLYEALLEGAAGFCVIPPGRGQLILEPPQAEISMDGIKIRPETMKVTIADPPNPTK